jgi:hypothetical protein
VPLVLLSAPRRRRGPHADALNATFCRGLDAAVAELRQRELDEHVLGAASLERDCVSRNYSSWFVLSSTFFWSKTFTTGERLHGALQALSQCCGTRRGLRAQCSRPP